MEVWEKRIDNANLAMSKARQGYEEVLEKSSKGFITKK